MTDLYKAKSYTDLDGIRSCRDMFLATFLQAFVGGEGGGHSVYLVLTKILSSAFLMQTVDMLIKKLHAFDCQIAVKSMQL